MSTGNAADQAAPAAVANDVLNAPVSAAVAAQVIERTSAPNSFVVHVDELDPKHFANPRKQMLESAVQEMQQSLRIHGQGQEIQVARIPNSALLAVVAGYTRTEAQTRNVFTPLILKWNKDKGLKVGEENFLLVNNPAHRAIVKDAYPEEYAAQRNDEKNKLRVVIDPKVTTAGQARIKAGVENFHRTDMPLQDQFDLINDLIDVDGFKANEVSKQLKKSEATISQMRKSAKIAPKLRSILVTPDEGETMSESDLTSIKENAKVMVDEFERRLSLPRDNAEAISFSHVREFAPNVVVEGKLPMLRKHYDELLCNLIGMNSKHKLESGKSPEVYALWLARMKAFMEETKAKREGKAAPVAASDKPAASEGPKAGSGEVGEVTGTVEGLAEQQVSSGKAAEATVTPTATATPATPVVAATPDINAPAVTASPATPAPKAPDNADIDLKIGALVGGGDVTDTDVEPVGPAGQKSAKTQTAPIVGIKLKDVNTILGATKAFAIQAAEEEGEDEDDRKVGLVAGALASAAFGYEMLGMSDEKAKMDEAYDDYVEKLEQYILGLELYAEQAVKTKGNKLKPFDGERPLVQLTEAEDAFGDAADAEGPSDKDLAELDEESDDASAEDEAALDSLVNPGDQG